MQFLHTEGRRIVDEDGRDILLQGFGLGNWMVQEGFLFGSSSFMAGGMRPFMRQEGMHGGRSIDQTIAEVCGRAYADRFWKRFYENYFGEADAKDLAERGLNSVRIPLNARVLLREEPGYVFDEEGFAALERAVGLCEKYGLYVILDLHAACGGQSAISCDDSWDNQPHLFTDEESWERTIALWEELARRYADRACVAGYELLNEPLSLPVTDPLLPKLALFYEECVRRIRKIDRKHILFLQGHRFASRADLFLAPLPKRETIREEGKDVPAAADDAEERFGAESGRPGAWVDPECRNWVLTFHMYETLPDLTSLGHIFAASRDLDVPVWMGETGGSSEYMTVLYEMLYEHQIGVNVWCHKGEESSDAAWLCSFSMPRDFGLIQDYAQKGGAKPSYERAMRIFDEYLENVRFENCAKHGDRVDAMLRRAPLEVPATGYDMLPGRDVTEDGSGGGSFFGREEYCGYTAYRAEDHMHIVCEPRYMPLDSAAFAWASAGRPPKYGDWPHLELRLDEGEYACYTLREADGPVSAVLEVRAYADAELEVTFSSAGERDLVSDILRVSGMPGGELRELRFGPAASGAGVYRIRCLRGSAVLKRVRFEV